jgi:DNA-directed RNA polymerase specialized sigma24 family protein
MGVSGNPLESAVVGSIVSVGAAEEFSEFVRAHERRLRQALVALYGSEGARDAVADALAYAWQHWTRVRGMANPAGYVYRVARSRGRPRKVRPVFARGASGLPDVEPGLAAAMAGLPERQRVAVLLVHGWEWRHQEVADLMGVSVSTVRNHLRRGMERLRSELGVQIDG